MLNLNCPSGSWAAKKVKEIENRHNDILKEMQRVIFQLESRIDLLENEIMHLRVRMNAQVSKEELDKL